jgi:hypothetical protein
MVKKHMQAQHPNLPLFVLRGVALINGLFFALALVPLGHGSTNGLDWLAGFFGAYRWNGYSPVFLWLAATTTMVFLVLCMFLFEGLTEGREALRARSFDIVFCLALVIGFVACIA